MNVCILCWHGDEQDDAFLMRTISGVLGYQITTSQLVMAFMTELALSPRLLCTIDNGICMEYVQGEPITWATRHRLLEPQVWK